MAIHATTIRNLLNQGPMTPRQLVERLSSQPTTFRALRFQMKSLDRNEDSFNMLYETLCGGFESVPIYRITEEGCIYVLGTSSFR